MEYITIIEATTRYKKSLSTIKRIVSKAPQKNLRRGDKLNTGKYRVLVSVDYLNSSFNVSNETTKEPTNDLLKTLQNELHSKQTIIDKLLKNQEQFLENERNFQILLERGNQRAELLEQHFNRNREQQPEEIHEEIKPIDQELSEDKIPSDRASFEEWIKLFN